MVLYERCLYASSFLETEAYRKEIKGVGHYELTLADYKFHEVLKILVVEEKKSISDM